MSSYERPSQQDRFGLWFLAPVLKHQGHTLTCHICSDRRPQGLEFLNHWSRLKKGQSVGMLMCFVPPPPLPDPTRLPGPLYAQPCWTNVLNRTDQETVLHPQEEIVAKGWSVRAMGSHNLWFAHCLSKHYIDLLSPFPQCQGQEGVNGLTLLSERYLIRT